MPDQLNGRVDFWNIGYPLGAVVYLTGLIALAAIGWALYRRSRYWRLGAANPDAGPLAPRLAAFGRWVLADAFGHRKFVRHETLPGVMHALVFWGIAGLFVATLVSAAEFNAAEYLGWQLATVRWSLQLELVWDLAGLALMAGLTIAVYRRYVQRVARLNTVLENGVLLGLLYSMALSGFALQALRQAATELEPASALFDEGAAMWSPASYVLAVAIRNAGASLYGIEATHFGLWWAHAALMSATFVYAAWRFGPLMHIFVSPVALFMRSSLHRPKGALRPMGDLTALDHFGASDLPHLTTKQLIDFDACTNCGRCQDQCPAWASGKALSPRKLVQDAKAYMTAHAPALLAGGAAAPTGQDDAALVHEAVTDDVLWACTTCGACVEACPVGIEHIDTIVDMRRYLTMEEATTPETAMQALTSMEQRGHPWRGTQATRTDWMEGTGAVTMAEDPDHEVLLWVGCTPALDPRTQAVARAMASVLKVAGIRYRVLGEEEACTGDPARRLGNEYLFETLARGNIETLDRYGVQHIVTMCPHCFNSLKNEYPQLGGHYEVQHYTQFVGQLVREGRIKPVVAVETTMAYHDSCYMGRHNGVFDEPREIAKAIPGLELVEVTDHSRERSFCCGAGGGRMWMEEEGQRVNHLRTDQLLATGADTIGVSCPFCLQMMDEGLSAKRATGTKAAKDVIELLAESLTPDSSG